jgi:hypothetical protein
VNEIRRDSKTGKLPQSVCVYDFLVLVRGAQLLESIGGKEKKKKKKQQHWFELLRAC